MKIVLAFTLVVVALFGLIAILGHMDGTLVFGEPGEDDSVVIDSGAITGEERAYLEFVVGTMQRASNDISTLGMLFSRPEFEDEAWKANTTIVLNRIERAHGAIVALEPSERLQDFQNASVRALDHSGEFARMIRAQLVQGEAELTGEAAMQLLAAAEAFGEAEYLLDVFASEHAMLD